MVALETSLWLRLRRALALSLHAVAPPVAPPVGTAAIQDGEPDFLPLPLWLAKLLRRLYRSEEDGR